MAGAGLTPRGGSARNGRSNLTHVPASRRIRSAVLGGMAAALLGCGALVTVGIAASSSDYPDLRPLLPTSTDNPRWVDTYEAAVGEYAVCRLVSASGPVPGPDEQRLVELHDERTGVAERLPLA